MRDIAITAIAVILFVVGFFLGQLAGPDIRLVGYGCAGASGPLYALEESDFPPCAAIEEIG